MPGDTFSKFFFETNIVTDVPGMIISQGFNKHTGGSVQRRITFSFEEILSEIVIETERRLGNNAHDFLYRIGCDLGLRLFVLNNIQKVPKHLVPQIIEGAFIHLKIGALGDSSGIQLNHEQMSIRIFGKNNMICRRTGNGDIFAGLIASLFSCIYGREMSARKTSCCSRGDDLCEIICAPTGKEYVPDLTQFSAEKEYDEYNFETIEKNGEFPSLKEMISFKKIILTEKGKLEVKDLALMPAEIGWYGIIHRDFHLEKIEDVLEQGISNGTASASKRIFNGLGSTKEKLAYLRNLLSAIGWGIPYIDDEDGTIRARLVHPPYNRFGLGFQAYELRGYLSSIIGRKLRLRKLDYAIKPYTAAIQYVQAE